MSDYGNLLGIRDASMADNLAYIVGRERGRGKVLAFAHNSHLQRGVAVWPWYTFWPAGSHLNPERNIFRMITFPEAAHSHSKVMARL